MRGSGSARRLSASLWRLARNMIANWNHPGSRLHGNVYLRTPCAPLRKRTKKKSAATNPVRPSRDGDQFHYLWAARRCLNLLLPESNLKAVTIEGASPSEKTASGSVKAGEEVIDVAEYFGDSNFEHATLVRYIQLKHSTEAPGRPWPASGLQKTIEGFAKRYKAILAAPTTSGKRPILEFLFVSNRPISQAIAQAVDNAAKALPVKTAELNKATPKNYRIRSNFSAR